MASALNWAKTPSYEAARQWLQKLGLFKLSRPKIKANDWVYIVDISIQMGSQKCLVIVGARISKITANRSLRFEDMEPLVVKTLEKCPGEVVLEAFEEAIEMTGTPAAIITDGGAELKKGCRLLKEKGHDTAHLSDFVHKLNTFLKKDLDQDDDWSKFKKLATRTIQSLKLSSISHLVPPRQRQKDRLLASDSLIEWGRYMLVYVDSIFDSSLSNNLKDKIFWIRDFREKLETWHQLSCLCKTSLNHVQKKGYYSGVSEDVISLFPWSYYVEDRPWHLIEEVYNFLRGQEELIPVGQSYPASSEILESTFGKFKQLEQQHAHSGLTSLVLAIPAVLGEVTESVIEAAMNHVPIGDVKAWLQTNMGTSYRSKRQRAFGTRATA